mgnify:CR=1 FL=1
MANDPIKQFQIKELAGPVNIGGLEISFTNSALFMAVAVGIVTTILLVVFTLAFVIAILAQVEVQLRLLVAPGERAEAASAALLGLDVGEPKHRPGDGDVLGDRDGPEDRLLAA